MEYNFWRRKYEFETEIGVWNKRKENKFLMHFLRERLEFTSSDMNTTYACLYFLVRDSNRNPESSPMYSIVEWRID